MARIGSSSIRQMASHRLIFHVARDDAVAKFWLKSAPTRSQFGLRPAELRRIREYHCRATSSLVESVA
jgi:hypothetical protein